MEVFPVNHHNEQKEGKHNSEHVLKFLIPNLLDVGNDFSDHFLPDFLFFGDEKLTDILISIWSIELYGSAKCENYREQGDREKYKSDNVQHIGG